MENAGPDSEAAAKQLRRQSEARRKRILENAKSRLNKLKAVQESPKDVVTTAPDTDTVAVHSTKEPDPPDEVIKRIPVFPSSRINFANVSLLNRLLSSVKNDSGYRLRIIVCIVCSVIISIVNILGGYLVPYVVSTCILDFTLFVWLTLQKSYQSNVPDNHLGWLGIARLPLSFIYPVLSNVFENVCLSLMLLGTLLGDILLVVFCSVTSVAMVQLLVDVLST